MLPPSSSSSCERWFSPMRTLISYSSLLSRNLLASLPNKAVRIYEATANVEMPSRAAFSLSISTMISGLFITKSEVRFSMPATPALRIPSRSCFSKTVSTLKSSPAISMLTGLPVATPLASRSTEISMPGISCVFLRMSSKTPLVRNPIRSLASMKATVILLRYEAGWRSAGLPCGLPASLPTFTITDSTLSRFGLITSYTRFSTRRVTESVTKASVPTGILAYTYTKFGSPLGKKITLGFAMMVTTTERMSSNKAAPMKKNEL